MSGGSSGVSSGVSSGAPFGASFGASSALVAGVGVLARALAVPLAAAALVALGAGLLQTRGLLALGALRPNLARLSPAAGLSRTFGGKAALEIGKGLLKAMLVASLAWLTVRSVLAGLAGLARGERLLAERIKQVAREAGVPIFRDVTLARSLRDLPEGTEIPAALYEAVAEILRVVYGMNAPAASPPTSAATPASRSSGVGWK